ncbi:MAG TPA: methyltransferase domain-containing protein [Chloroflexota bacterium]|jgi:O-methyltransferase/aklanonic acid methyltransferase|nr:methyltransferase domain-containing protein [Chloroflexota bacterium]
MAEVGDFDAASFKEVDRRSYDLFARTWDRYSAALSGPFAPRLLEMAGVSPGQRALEVCCGTGVISRAAAAAVGPSGRVLGTDLTPGMIEVAREQAAAQGLRQAEFRVMDCEALELADGTFDVGLAMYPHFSDHRRALGELHRVLRPGGRVAIGVGGGLARSQPARPPLALQLMNEIIARHQPEDPGGHPPNWAGPDPAAGLTAALAEAGFADLRTASHTHPTRLASPEEAWDVWSMTSSPVRHRLSLLGPDEREAVRRDFLAAFAPHATPENLERRGGAVYVAGRKPA